MKKYLPSTVNVLIVILPAYSWQLLQVTLCLNHFYQIFILLKYSFEFFSAPGSSSHTLSNSKGKVKYTNSNHLNTPISDFDKAPLVDTQTKISETLSEFDLHKLHNWAKKKYLDNNDELRNWKSFLSQFVFSQTHLLEWGPLGHTFWCNFS